jgi:hypothetical protein
VTGEAALAELDGDLRSREAAADDDDAHRFGRGKKLLFLKKK